MADQISPPLPGRILSAKERLRQAGSIWASNEMPNNGPIALPQGSTNAISYEGIESKNKMINFHGERNRGRYYKKTTFNSLPKNSSGYKSNPFTRAKILPGNARSYTAKGGVKTRRNPRRKRTQKRRV